MKLLDGLALGVVLVSLVLFARGTGAGDREAGPVGLRVYEGEVLTSGGRNGTAELRFLSLEKGNITCNVTARVNQFVLLKHYETSENVVFPPGTSLTNISIFLPNGRNKVVLDVQC